MCTCTACVREGLIFGIWKRVPVLVVAGERMGRLAVVMPGDGAMGGKVEMSAM